MITIATHLSERSDSKGYRVRLLKEIAALNPGLHIIFILDSPRIKLQGLPSNCTVNVTGPRVRNKLLKRYYYQFKIPALLLRYDVSVFIPDGAPVVKLDAKQYMVNEGRIPKQDIRFLSGIITPRETETGSPVKDQNVITVLPGAHSTIVPYSYDEKIKVLDELTGGDEFFVTHFAKNSINDFMAVMKAYSNFRKWQRSAMKLVIIYEDAVQELIESKLSTYKYRFDVILRAEEELERIMPAGYAFIDTSKEIYNALNAFASHVPVITLHTNRFEEAVLKATADETSISDKMMVLYKDEIQRQQLISTGSLIPEKYNWRTGIGRLLHLMER